MFARALVTIKYINHAAAGVLNQLYLGFRLDLAHLHLEREHTALVFAFAEHLDAPVVHLDELLANH